MRTSARIKFVSCIVAAVVGWLLGGFFLPEGGGKISDDPVVTNRVDDDSPAKIFSNLTPAQIASRFSNVRTTAECERLFHELASLGSGQMRALAETALVARWIELDGQHALEFALACEEFHPLPFLTKVVEAWAEHDPEAAFKAHFTHKLWDRFTRKADASVRHLAELDPDRALEILRKHPIDSDDDAYYYLGFGDGSHKAYTVVFAELAKRDRAKALELAAAMPDGVGSAFRGIAGVWLAEDPTAAIPWMEGMPDHSSHMQGAFHLWSKEDPESAGAHFSSIENRELRRRAIDVVAESWIGKDPAAAVKWAIDLPGEDADKATAVFSKALVKIGQVDPDRAREILTHLPNELREVAQEKLNEGTRMAEIDSRAAGDPNATLTWLSGLDGEALETARQRVAQKWAQENPQALADNIDAFVGDQSSQNTWILSGVAGRLLESDPDRAQALMERLPADQRDDVYAGILRDRTRENPVSAARYLDDFEDGRTKDTAVQHAVTHWAKHDPEATRDWIETLPADGEARAYASQNLVAAWARHDLEAAASWAQSQPPNTPAADHANYALALATADSDTDAALALVATIGEPGLRRTAYRNLLRPIQRHDAARAAKILDTIDLPENLMGYLRNELK